MKVYEIFSSIEGEGIRAGQLCTFIRLAGCNLNCSYCDTTYAMLKCAGYETSVDNILGLVDEISYSNNVTITGGEPLFRDAEELKQLLHKLTVSGYNVNIETNGSIDVEPFRMPGVFFTVDYKSPSSGMNHRMLTEMYSRLQPQDVVKFVVGNRADLIAAETFCKINDIKAQVYVSPVYGKIEMSDIVDFMKTYRLNWTLQVQLHKIIWDPDKRGV